VEGRNKKVGGVRTGVETKDGCEHHQQGETQREEKKRRSLGIRATTI